MRYLQNHLVSQSERKNTKPCDHVSTPKTPPHRPLPLRVHRSSAIQTPIPPIVTIHKSSYRKRNLQRRPDTLRGRLLRPHGSRLRSTVSHINKIWRPHFTSQKRSSEGKKIGSRRESEKSGTTKECSVVDGEKGSTVADAPKTDEAIRQGCACGNPTAVLNLLFFGTSQRGNMILRGIGVCSFLYLF